LSRRAAGFTLLEVMIAMAILALALVAIMDGQGSAIVAARKSRTIEVATLLAREKMELLSLDVEKNGFTDEKETSCDEGTFGDHGREDIRWKACVIKVEMNLNITDVGAIANAIMGGDGEDGEGDGAGADAEGGGGALAAMGLDPSMLGFALEMLPMITDQLSQAIRRVELTVSWSEIGVGPQSFRLILYVTDPSRASLGMDAMMGAGAAGAGAAGAGATGAGAAGAGSPIARPGTGPGVPR